MRVIIQRVLTASVSISGEKIASIKEGLLILVGIENTDNEIDIDFLSKKIINLRIFDDSNGIMNNSVSDIGGEILCVSQFTLFASTKKGNRPSYIKSSKSDFAIPVYNKFCTSLSLLLGKPIKMGIFGADMQVELLNNGPVTIFMDSKNKE